MPIFCYVKDHTELDLVLSNDCQPNAKLMLLWYPNEFKLKPNILSAITDRHNEENNYNTLHRRKDKSVETYKPEYNELVLN